MIDLTIFKEDILNRILSSSSKQTTSKELMYGINLIEEKLSFAQQELIELKEKLSKYESGDFIVIPREPNKQVET